MVRRIWQWSQESQLGTVIEDLVHVWYPPCVVLFEGPLGSGKTTMIRELFHHLGVLQSVKSPTFNLVHSYALGRYRLVHADLYRLDDRRDVESLDLPSPDEVDTMLVVEWGQSLSEAYPERFDATIEVLEGGSRLLKVHAFGTMAEARLGSMPGTDPETGE